MSSSQDLIAKKEALRKQKQLDALPWDLTKHRSEYEITSKSGKREKFKPKRIGKLEVILYEAKDLVPQETKKNCEPSIRFKVGPTEYKSSTQRSLRPDWEGEKFTFLILDLKKAKTSKLEIKVYDENNKKEIGEFALPMSDIITGTYDVPRWIQIFHNNRDFAGQVRMLVSSFGFNNL